MELITRLDDWFDANLIHVNCRDDTKAYIIGILSSRKIHDMSKESIVLCFNEATMTGNFSKFQRIGDWTLWTSIFAQPREMCQQNLVETFGRLSYYACHRIMRRQWVLYEELADELPSIVRDAKRQIFNVNKFVNQRDET